MKFDQNCEHVPLKGIFIIKHCVFHERMLSTANTFDFAQIKN